MNNSRIYIVIGTFLPLVGGAEKQALMQGRSLRKRGYETTIITFRYNRQWLPQEMIEGVPVLRVAGRFLTGREHFPRLIQRLSYLLAVFVMGWSLWQQRRHYDILHVYQLTLLALPVAFVCWVTRKPLIVAVRSAGSGKKTQLLTDLSLLPGSLTKSTSWLRIDGQNWVDGDLESLARMGKLVVWLTRFLLLKTDAVLIVLSSRMKSYLATYGFALPGMQLIPNGVDVFRFQPNFDVPFEQRAKVVVCVSKLRYEKGIDVLLHAWHIVHKQLLNQSDAKLVLIGDGPLQSQLERIVQELGIADSIEFVGLQNDIPSQLHRGALAVLPSRWEGMPNALLEAMSCGLPCVATRVSGSEDIIQHGVNGLLVEPEDYQEMAQALLLLLCNPELTQKYGCSARATIETHYSLEHITDNYVELYQKLDKAVYSRRQGL